LFCWSKSSPFQFRGRYSVEPHQSFLRLQGQANDFKIQYSSILRLFVLPKVTLFWFFYLCVVSSYCMAHSLLPLLCHCWLQSNRVISFCHICSHKIHILFVVIALDPPIRKGQTLYPHIVIQVLYHNPVFTLNLINRTKKWVSLLCEQFETEAIVERELGLSEQVLAEKYKDRLKGSYRVIYLLTLISTICLHQLMSTVVK